MIKRLHDKKGQAAMEFLMTYGWAILAAIIAIGVLAYFGVFNPGRLAGSQGLITAPFNIDSFNIVDTTTDAINLEITQNSGSSIFLHAEVNDEDCAYNELCGIEVDLTNPDTYDCATALATGSTAGILNDGATDDDVSETGWPSGTSETFVVSGCTDGTSTTDWNSGDQIAASITVNYYTSTGGLLQTSTGTVRGVSQ